MCRRMRQEGRAATPCSRVERHYSYAADAAPPVVEEKKTSVLKQKTILD